MNCIKAATTPQTKAKLKAQTKSQTESRAYQPRFGIPSMPIHRSSNREVWIEPGFNDKTAAEKYNELLQIPQEASQKNWRARIPSYELRARATSLVWMAMQTQNDPNERAPWPFVEGVDSHALRVQLFVPVKAFNRTLIVNGYTALP